MPGYLHDGWWTHLDFAIDDPNTLSRIANEVDEVARALVLERRIATPFIGFDERLPTIEIDKCEVRRRLLANGYGRLAVELIRSRWAPFQTVAFSLDADHFLRGVSFVQRQRRDRARGYKPFFVAPQLT